MSSKAKVAAQAKKPGKPASQELDAKRACDVSQDESNEVVKKLSAVADLDPELKSRFTPELLARVAKNPEVISIFRKASFHGPLPPPDMLDQYNHVLPGGAERIFQLTEKEQSHRHDTQLKALNGAVSKDRRGQWMGFVIAMAILFAASYFAYEGKTVFAGTMITLDLVSLVAVFVYGRKPARKSTKK